jgi:hypothetical protein
MVLYKVNFVKVDFCSLSLCDAKRDSTWNLENEKNPAKKRDKQLMHFLHNKKRYFKKIPLKSGISDSHTFCVAKNGSLLTYSSYTVLPLQTRHS